MNHAYFSPLPYFVFDILSLSHWAPFGSVRPSHWSSLFSVPVSLFSLAQNGLGFGAGFGAGGALVLWRDKKRLALFLADGHVWRRIG